jgi:ankyrin repeat protein
LTIARRECMRGLYRRRPGSSVANYFNLPINLLIDCRPRQDVVDDLLEAGAPANARTQSDYTPLHVAAGQGHLHLLRRLHAAGANASGETWVQNTVSPSSLLL